MATRISDHLDGVHISPPECVWWFLHRAVFQLHGIWPNLVSFAVVGAHFASSSMFLAAVVTGK